MKKSLIFHQYQLHDQRLQENGNTVVIVISQFDLNQNVFIEINQGFYLHLER